MAGSIVVPLVAGALVVLALLAGGAMVGGYLLWRYGRRRLRAVRSHPVAVGCLALWGAVASLRDARSGRAPAGGSLQWSARRTRREMWRAVDRAESSVGAAIAAGAPTASLESLCGRLRSAATHLNRVLRVDAAAAVPDAVGDQAAGVIRVASDVHRAAVTSASDANGQRVSVLARDTEDELRCLHAGLASARGVMAGPSR